MKTLSFEIKEDWFDARRGKITGSRLKDIVVKRGTEKKMGYYELIAERLATEPEGDETPMDRGTRLEGEAMERFIKETGKDVDTSLMLWTRDENNSIAISPDGFVKGKKIREAIEIKCLSSASHIKAFLTQEIPSEYEMQAIQYFCVNDDLEELHFVFYDPRIIVKDYFVIEIKRADIKEKIEEVLKYQQAVLEEVETIVNNLTF